MIRRFNYTGRRKIARSRVRIRVADEASRRRFDAEIALDDMPLPADAALFVEAYHRSAYRRYDFGTVGEPHPPADRWLDGIAARKPLFRVKVVQAKDGVARILAAADRVVPEDAGAANDERMSLLPVEYRNLGDRIWALDLESDWPCLLLNQRFEGIRDAARSGGEFLSLVYPEIFRAILTRALQGGDADPDCDDDRWETLWLRFACYELKRPHPPESGDGDYEDWIEEAVDAFCVRTEAAVHFQRLLAGQAE